MPKPIDNVDKIYLKGLLEAVIKRANLSLSSKEDYKRLEDEIINVCGTRISHSTLKRLFNGNEKNNPTKAILDILTKFIGFPSWKHYLANARQYDKYLLNHSLSIIIITKTIDIEKVKNLCDKYGHLQEIYTFIFSVIRLALEQKNNEFFAQLFSLTNLFNKTYHTEYDFYYLGQAICLAMREDETMAKSLAANYSNNPLAVQYCIESFVDEDYLSGYYGVWLDEYHKHKTETQSLAFYYAMKYKEAFMDNRKVEASKWHEKIEILKPTKAFFIIVEERCTAIKLIEEIHIPDDKTDAIYKRLKEISESLNGEYNGCPLYLLRYLFMAQKHDWIVAIVNLFDQYPIKTDEHWLEKQANALQLYKAFAYHLQKQNEKAINLFNKVDTHLFEPFMYKCMMNDYNTIKTALDI